MALSPADYQAQQNAQIAQQRASAANDTALQNHILHMQHINAMPHTAAVSNQATAYGNQAADINQQANATGQIARNTLAGTNPNTQIYSAANAPTQQVAPAPAPNATYAMQPVQQQAPQAVNPMASRINAIGSAITGGYQ